MSISSYPDKSERWVLNVMFFICFESSLENPLISFKYGKKHTLCALPHFPFLPFSDVSTSLPKIIQTLFL